MKIPAFCLLFSLALPAAANAQDAGLHHLRAGAQLAFAQEDTRLLNAALGAKEFDVSLTKALIDEINGTLADAKRSVDRASALLSDGQSKLEGDFTQLREIIVKAERQIEATKKVVEAETKGLDADEGDAADPSLADSPTRGDDEEQAGPNWTAMKDAAAWTYFDVAAAKSAHAKVTRRLKPPAGRTPKKPKGKRG